VLVVVHARRHQGKVLQAILGWRVVVIAQPHSDVRLNCAAKQAVSHGCRSVCNQCVQEPACVPAAWRGSLHACDCHSLVHVRQPRAFAVKAREWLPRLGVEVCRANVYII